VVRPCGDPLQRIGRGLGFPHMPEGRGEAGYGVRRVFRDGPTSRPTAFLAPPGVAEATRAVGKGLSDRRRGSCGLRHRPPRPWPPARAGAGPRGSADRAARSPVRMNVRAPRDLGAVFPDGPVRAARHRCRASSRGVVQRTPLHRTAGESTPGAGIAACAVGPRRPAVSTFRPRGFSPPRRFAPPRPRGPVASRCRSWGSPRFRLAARPPVARSPHDGASPRCFPALRSLVPRRQPGPRVTARASRPVRSPRALALLAFLPPAASTVARRACPESRASRALLRRRVRNPRRRCR
jgi:hypothetical protein